MASLAFCPLTAPRTELSIPKYCVMSLQQGIMDESRQSVMLYTDPSRGITPFRSGCQDVVRHSTCSTWICVDSWDLCVDRGIWIASGRAPTAFRRP